MSVRVVPFTKDQYTPADKSGPPLFSWREFYGFRNDLLSVLGRYGSVGPEGEMPIHWTFKASKRAWKSGTRNPDFFVVSDMYNQYDRWNRVEADPWRTTAETLHDVIAMVRRWPGWCVYMALIQGGLTILGDRVLYEGDLFAEAATEEELGLRCAMTKPLT